MKCATNNSELSDVDRELQRLFVFAWPICTSENWWHRCLSYEEQRVLGGSVEAACKLHGRTVSMWRYLNGGSITEAVIDIALGCSQIPPWKASWLRREKGIDVDLNQIMERAIASGDLVVIDRPRAAYLNSELIGIEWTKYAALWGFFELLCKRSKSAKAVESDDFGYQPPHVAKLKSKLTNLPAFPSDLEKKIESQRGEVRLNLPVSKIHIFEMVAPETYRAWRPW